MVPRDLSLTATLPTDALLRDDLDCVPAASAGDVAGVRDWLLACSAHDMTGVGYRIAAAGSGELRFPFGDGRHAPIAASDQATVIAAIQGGAVRRRPGFPGP